MSGSLWREKCRLLRIIIRINGVFPFARGCLAPPHSAKNNSCPPATHDKSLIERKKTKLVAERCVGDSGLLEAERCVDDSGLPVAACRTRLA